MNRRDFLPRLGGGDKSVSGGTQLLPLRAPGQKLGLAKWLRREEEKKDVLRGRDIGRGPLLFHGRKKMREGMRREGKKRYSYIKWTLRKVDSRSPNDRGRKRGLYLLREASGEKISAYLKRLREARQVARL